MKKFLRNGFFLSIILRILPETYILHYLSDDAYIPDMILPIFATLPYIHNAYTWQISVYSELDRDELWSGAYKRIFSYNIIINRVLGSEGAGDAEKRSVRAEAFVGRALEYFYLVNAYGPAYDAATAATDVAVPLILEADINQTGIVKSPVKKVYEQMIADLTEALPDLPDRPRHNNFRASKSAAYGLLSRIGLYMADYTMALQNATEVLKVHNTLLDLNDYQVVNPDISIGRHNLPDAKDSPEVFYARTFPYSYGPAGLVWVSDELKKMYKEGDRRWDLYYSYFFEMMGSELPWANYCAFVKMSVTPGVPEIYLNRAECYARAGGAANRQLALADLNTLRQKRFTQDKYIALQSTDDKEVLRMVLDERRCELAFMGLRLFDQKRLNKEPEFKKDCSRTIKGEVVTLTPDSPQYILPVWPKVVQMNSNL